MKQFIISILILIPLCAAAGPHNTLNPSALAPKTQSAAPAPQNAAPGYCLFGAQSGKSFNGEAAFKSIIWKSDIIYIGETPGLINAQLAQLEALKAMRIARSSKIAVGFEMIDAALQPILDNYAAGRISEEEFINNTGWGKEQVIDFELYKPLFDLIARNNLRALALNIPQKTLSRIANSGLAGLDDEDKKLMPGQINITKHKKYMEYLKASFDGQSGTPIPLTWDNFLSAMSARDEGMGAKIADFINANPGWSALVIVDNGRIIYNAGIPSSVKSRTKGARQASFYTEEAACPAALPKERKNLANYIWYIPAAPPAAPPAVPPAVPGNQ